MKQTVTRSVKTTTKKTKTTETQTHEEIENKSSGVENEVLIKVLDVLQFIILAWLVAKQPWLLILLVIRFEIFL